MKCSNCKTEILPGDEVCPVCGNKIPETGEMEKTGKMKRLMPYILNILIAIAGFAFAKIWSIRLTSPEDAISEYGRFSPEAIYAQRYTHLTDIWMAVFLILAVIYLASAVYCGIKKGENRFSIFAMCFCLLVTVTAGVSSYAYSKRVNDADIISIKSREELTFSPPSVCGGTLATAPEFEVNMYSYYVTFARAYNDLARDGNYEVFFNTVNENNFQNLNYLLNELKNIYLYDGGEYSHLTDVAFLPEEVPYRSINAGSIPSNHEINEALKHSLDGKTMDKLVEKYIERANILFDTFYGKELICEEDPVYNPKIYTGNFLNPDGRNCLNIKSLTIDEKGNGEIEFEYSHLNTSFKEKIKNRKCFFRYKSNFGSGYGMLHITQNNIIMNISEKSGVGFAKSDVYHIE